MAKKNKSAKSTRNEDEQLSFEESLTRLEEIVNALEAGQIGLNESLAKYQQGIKYLNLCHKSLKDVEREIKRVVSMDNDGNARLVPFEDELTTADNMENGIGNDDNDNDDDEDEDSEDSARLF